VKVKAVALAGEATASRLATATVAVKIVVGFMHPSSLE
jgi:hypothetical protein